MSFFLLSMTEGETKARCTSNFLQEAEKWEIVVGDISVTGKSSLTLSYFFSLWPNFSSGWFKKPKQTNKQTKPNNPLTKLDCLYCLTFARIRSGLLPLIEECLTFLTFCSFYPWWSRQSEGLTRQVCHKHILVLSGPRNPVKTEFRCTSQHLLLKQ